MRKHPLLVAGLLVTFLCCAVCGGLALKLAKDFGTLGNDGEWTPTAIAQREVPRVFGVSLPATMSDFVGHNEGFQDWFGAVAFRLPSSELEGWLAANGLTRASGAPSFQCDEAVDVIVVRAAPKGKVRVTALDGLHDLTSPDGGRTELTRAAAVLEWEDQVWVYLEAFDT